MKTSLFGIAAFLAGALPCAAAFADGHQLVKTYVNTATVSLAPFGSTNTPLDAPTTVNCPATTGCTITLHAAVQMYTGGLAGPVVFIIQGTVDGSVMNGGKTVAGAIGAYSSTTGMAFENFFVSQGTHTVQSNIWVAPSGVVVSYYQLEYSVMKP